VGRLDASLQAMPRNKEVETADLDTDKVRNKRNDGRYFSASSS
jgi:hypothetical protein